MFASVQIEGFHRLFGSLLITRNLGERGLALIVSQSLESEVRIRECFPSARARPLAVPL